MTDQSRLSKLLNMLAAEEATIRAVAGLKIAQMAKEANKTVTELVMTGGPPQIIYRDRIVEKTVYRDRPDKPEAPGPQSGRIMENLRYVRQFEEHLSPWDMEFIDSILHTCYSDFDLSHRQEKAARRIIHSVRTMIDEEESLI